MTKRESILLKIFIILLIVVFFCASFSYLLTSIKASQEGIEQYEKMREKLLSKSTNQDDALYLINGDTYSQEYTISDITDMILEDLRNKNIIPQRYQILDTQQGIIIDVNIKCLNTQFVEYFYEMEEGFYPYTISSINLKTGIEFITATVRYTVNPSILVDKKEKVPKQQLSFLFRPMYKPQLQKENKERTAIVKADEETVIEIIENGTEKYKVIGNIIENDGLSFLYIKSVGVNRIYKISENDVIENNQKEYIIRLDNRKIRIEKDR